MEDFVPMNPWMFVGVCFSWLALAFFFLGARKVYFEPYPEDKND